MPIIDERGRIFGRFNLIDAGIALVVLVLLPIGYAGYRLFRPTPIEIIDVVPSRVALGGDMRIKIQGRYFVPYLRAQVGTEQPKQLLIATPDEAELVLPDLAPGTYDLTLFNEAERVAQKKNAITIVPAPEPPPTRVQIVGWIFGLDQTAAAAMKPGRRFTSQPDAGIEIAEAGAPAPDLRRLHISGNSPATILAPARGSWRVPATLRAACTVTADAQRCKVNNVVIVPDAVLPLGDGVSFAVEDVRPDTPGVGLQLLVRFAGRPEVVDLMRPGDTDLMPGGGSRAARVVEVRGHQAVTAQTSSQISGGLGSVLETTTIPDRAVVVEAVIRLAADETPDGPVYRRNGVKPGALFTLDTARYVLRGAVVRVTPIQPGAGAGERDR